MSSELEASPEGLLERLREGLPLRPLGEIRRAKAEFERMLSGLRQEHPESAEISYGAPMDASRPLDRIRFYEQAIEICNLEIMGRGRKTPRNLSAKLEQLEQQRAAISSAFPSVIKDRRTIDPVWPQTEYDKLGQQIAKLKLRISLTVPAIQEPARQPVKEHDLLDTRADIASRRSIVRRNPGMSDKELCAQFDFSNVPVPENWREKHGVSEWGKAYMKPETRKLAESLISKERAKLKRRPKTP